MKKIISLMLVFLLIFSFVFALSSCGEKEPPEDDGGKNEDDGDIKLPPNLSGDIQLPIIPLEPSN